MRRRVLILSTVACHAQAFGTLWEPAVHRLLKPMILTGLSDPLTKALQKVARKLPGTVPIIRQHLLLPILASLPVTAEHADANAAGLTSTPASIGSSWHSLARYRDPGTSAGRAQAITRLCFHVRGAILKPDLVEFSKQVHAQVQPYAQMPLLHVVHSTQQQCLTRHANRIDAIPAGTRTPVSL
jgi:hypothetical protein